MTTLESALRQYYCEIRSYLPCSRKHKDRILNEIRTNILQYLEENPEVDFAGIQAHFGTPKTIAAAYVDDMDTEELLHALRVRKKIITTVVAAITTALLIWAAAVSIVYIQHVFPSEGHLIIETEELTHGN